MQTLFDPFIPEIIENPYPTYRVLRDKFPVYHNEERNFWALSQFNDVRAAGRDWERFSTTNGVDLDDTWKGLSIRSGVVELDETSKELMPGFFLGYDPPRHLHIRRIFQKTFSPKGLKALEPLIQMKVDELITKLHRPGSDRPS